MDAHRDGSVTVVVGGGVAGLVAARRLARRGAEVVVLERSDRLGGRVRAVDLGGVTVDGGAESFASRGGAVAALAGELGLGADVVEPRGSAWVALADRTVPLPAGGLLGIPSSPLATDVRAVIGAGGALRAYADRLLPVLKVGRYEHLGPLVASRMGRRVLDRLVAPVVEGVYGADPAAVPVDAIAPGLNGAITVTGSLSSAVLRLRTAAPPGSAALGIVGGMHRLVAALEADLASLGVAVRLGEEVTGLRAASPGFSVTTPSGAIDADRVVLAVDGGAALDLLRDIAPGPATLPRPAAVDTWAVLLLVDDARLDGRPRGSGVLRARERTGVGATAVTHVSAKWAWLEDRSPPHRHVLRLAYRGRPPGDDAAVRADAIALLDTRVGMPAARIDVAWRDEAPSLDPATLAIRRDLQAAGLPSGLALAGSWLHGTGLAAVVSGAERAAAALAV